MQITNLKQRVKEYFNKGDKFILTFLRNEEELILCCINQERQELLAKEKKTDHFE